MRHLTAPSVLHQENACGLANSSAQVQAVVLKPKKKMKFLTFCFIFSLHMEINVSIKMNYCAPFSRKQKSLVISPGETRRLLSVNPTYDWTCFSYALLNVSPMQVESSPPMPCPPPCHSLQNCSLCLGSRGSDGGWQHCVWSMALQQVRLSHSKLLVILCVFHMQVTVLLLF